MNVFQKQLLIDDVPMGIVSGNTKSTITTQPRQAVSVEEFERDMKEESVIMDEDIIKRLEDPEQYVNAVDDAIVEIKKLRAALRILADPAKQLEYTSGGYFIFRLKREDVMQIAKALYVRWVVGNSVITGFIEEAKQ